MNDDMIRRARNAFDILLRAMKNEESSMLRLEPEIRTLTVRLVQTVEKVAGPEDWAVYEYTDDYERYHPSDAPLWKELFLQAACISTELADVLCFLRGGGAVLIPDAVYGYIIRPMIGGCGYRSRAEYDDMKKPLARWRQEVTSLLRSLADRRKVTNVTKNL